MNRIIPVLFLLLAVTAVCGQSQKTIKEKGISTRTVYEYFIGEGFDDPVVESVRKYNREGELIEIKEMNKRGELRVWERYVYNERGQLVEELFLDEDGEVSRTEKTLYEGDLRVEKQFFDQKGRLFKKKVYEYGYY